MRNIWRFQTNRFALQSSSPFGLSTVYALAESIPIEGTSGLSDTIIYSISDNIATFNNILNQNSNKLIIDFEIHRQIGCTDEETELRMCECLNTDGSLRSTRVIRCRSNHKIVVKEYHDGRNWSVSQPLILNKYYEEGAMNA